MAQFFPLGPVKQRYCPECKLIAGQLCTHIVDVVIATDKRSTRMTVEQGTLQRVRLPKNLEQLEERVRARRRVDLSRPDITLEGTYLYRRVVGMKYSTSPYDRVYPRPQKRYGRVKRDFTDDRVYKEGSFTPRKRQPRKGKKAKKAKPASKVGAVNVEPAASTSMEPMIPVSTQVQHQQNISAMRKKWIGVPKELFGPHNQRKPQVAAASTSEEKPYIREVPKIGIERPGQA